MTERSGPRPEEAADEAALPKAAESRPQPAAQEPGDYRDELRSRRWNAAPLRNPEVQKTDPRLAILAIVILSAVTFIVLVAGYASGFWGLPAEAAPSGAVAALELLA